MRILIIGGSGFIGRAMADRFTAEGHETIIGSRSTTSPASGRAVFTWDGLTTPDLPPVDAIINLAGHSILANRWRPRVKALLRSSRVDLSAALVEGIGRAATRPRVLVNASAVGYYGDRGDESLSETSPPGTGLLGDLSRDWEAAADRAGEFGVRVVKIRTGIVMAADGGALAQMLLPFRLGLGGRFASGRQWMPWVHRADLISLYRAATLEDGYAGAYNGSAPEPVRNLEFTKELARVLHRPAILPVPLFAARLLLGEVAGVIAASQRAVPTRALAQGFVFAFPRLGEALADLLAGPEAARA